MKQVVFDYSVTQLYAVSYLNSDMFTFPPYLNPIVARRNLILEELLDGRL